MKKLFLIAVMAVACIGSITAQSTYKNLIGVWLMESMQWDGEKKTICGKETNYVQFKYYGADGEYACVEIVRNKKGQFVILPNEYGKYSYKNGAYSEMGRPAVDPKDFVIVDKNTIHGRWLTRNDVWKKANMPKKLVDYILNYCKIVKQGPSAEIQNLIQKNMFE